MKATRGDNTNRYQIRILQIQTKSELGDGRIVPEKNHTNNFRKLFSANTRSLKGKTEELSAETSHSDKVFLTKTRINSTIQNHQVFEFNHNNLRRGNSKPFYRHLNGSKLTKNQKKLKTNKSFITDIPHESPKLLYNYFRSQFNKEPPMGEQS